MASLNQHDEGESPADRTAVVEFGASLREIRLAHQRELSEVSEDLRIRQVFLRAIEDGRFEELPGPTYAVGFVRAYADYLGLDVVEVVERFKKMGVGPGRQTNLVPPSPVVEGRLPTGSILLVALMLAAGAYGGWYYLSLDGRADANGIAALPQRIAALVGMRSEPEAPPPAAKPKQAEPTGDKPAGNASEPVADSAAAEQTEQTAQPAPAEIDSAAAAPAPEQGDAGLTGTEPETTAAPAPEESATASDAPAAETPAEQPVPAAAAMPQPQPEVAPTAPAAPTAPETASIPEPAPAPPPAPVPEAAVEPAQTATMTPEPAAAPEPSPMQAAETAAASAPIVDIAPASGAAPQTPAQTAEPAKVAVETPSSSAPAAESSAPAAPQTASMAPAPKTRPSPPAIEPQVRVTLRATTNAWVEVRKRDKQTVFSRLMLSGEAVDLPVSPGMTLSTGNAGGIEILLDGEALPPLGPSGGVLRNMALDAASLRRNAASAQ